MDRIRDARRGTMAASAAAAASVPNGGLSRRRQRTNSLRDSPGCYNHLPSGSPPSPILALIWKFDSLSFSFFCYLLTLSDVVGRG